MPQPPQVGPPNIFCLAVSCLLLCFFFVCVPHGTLCPWLGRALSTEKAPEFQPPLPEACRPRVHEAQSCILVPYLLEPRVAWVAQCSYSGSFSLSPWLPRVRCQFPGFTSEMFSAHCLTCFPFCYNGGHLSVEGTACCLRRHLSSTVWKKFIWSE